MRVFLLERGGEAWLLGTGASEEERQGEEREKDRDRKRSRNGERNRERWEVRRAPLKGKQRVCIEGVLIGCS